MAENATQTLISRSSKAEESAQAISWTDGTRLAYEIIQEVSQRVAA